MRRFKNILAGLDLSAGGWFVTDELSAGTLQVVERAIWLARLNQARLTFFYSLDSRASQMSADRQILLEEHHGQRTVEDHAKEVLSKLVRQASAQGVADVEAVVALGKTWIEIIRRVISNKHDLVVVGTRHLGPVAGMLLGSTGLKLLRKCPCPVWVTQAAAGGGLKRVLVATDFSPVSDVAIDLGASMASLQASELHVVHALDCKVQDYVQRPTGKDRELIELIKDGMQMDAEREMERQLRRPAVAELKAPPDVHIVEGDPADCICEHVERLEIDLLVMGTLARTGIAGMFMGNTAERLLPRLSCSIVALKPEGFQSPVVAGE